MTVRCEQLTPKKIAPHGFCKNGVMFISIPKNNSTVIRGAGSIRIKNRSDQHGAPLTPFTFAVIRNPAERLISGAREWQKRNRPDSKMTIEEIIEHFDLWLPEFDEHIERQSWFLPSYQCHLFSFEKQEAVCKFLARHSNANWAARLKRALRPFEPYPDFLYKIAFKASQKRYEDDWRLYSAVTHSKDGWTVA